MLRSQFTTRYWNRAAELQQRVDVRIDSRIACLQCRRIRSWAYRTRRPSEQTYSVICWVLNLQCESKKLPPPL